jgi:hypothetical protein
VAISGPSPEGHAANQLFVGQDVMDMAVTKESRYAVGVFANGDALCQAHQELVEQGFPESDICLMAPANIVNASLAPHAPGILKKLGLVGEKGRSMRELMGKLGASGTHCAAGTVFTSEGSLCNCLGDGSSEDEGTWLSEVLGRWISRRSAEYFEDRLGEGKILMWVPMGHHNYSRREHLACNVLLHHASESVRVLDFALRN